jgi:hypothetical protein
MPKMTPRAKPKAVTIKVPNLGAFKQDELVEVYTLSGNFEGFILSVAQGAKSIIFKDDFEEDVFNILLGHVTVIRRVEGREGYTTKREQHEFLQEEESKKETSDVVWFDDDLEDEEDFDEEDDYEEEYEEYGEDED